MASFATTKPSTAKCDLETYTLFLLAETKYPGCTRLADILEGLSHDSVNRFLLRERYEPKDLFDEVKPHINLIGGTLSADDTVIDKPYSDPQLTAIFWLLLVGKTSSSSQRHSVNHVVLHRHIRQVYTCKLSDLQQTGGQDEK